MIIVILAFGLNRLCDLYLTGDTQTYLYPLKPMQVGDQRGLGFWISRLPLNLPLTLRSIYIIHSITPDKEKKKEKKCSLSSPARSDVISRCLGTVKLAAKSFEVFTSLVGRRRRLRNRKDTAIPVRRVTLLSRTVSKT